jgi:outer membrane protein assembly factor BamB
MQRRFTLFWLSCLLVCSSVQAQSSRIISDAELRRVGIERRWSAHLAVDTSRAVLKQLVLHVSSRHVRSLSEVNYKANSFDYTPNSKDAGGNRLGPNGALTAAEEHLRQLVVLGVPAILKSNTVGGVTTHTISCKDGKIRFRPGDRTAYGELLGVEGIDGAADRRVELLTAAQIEAVATRIDIPRMRLFATASNAVIHAVDGENGQTLWQRRIGNHLFPSFRVAANEEYLAVINGSTLYILDQDTGREIWHRSTVSVPGAGPALSDVYAFVPTVTAGLEVYETDASHAPKTIYHASGRNVVQPVVTSRSVTWPTNRGHMYVAAANELGLKFRVEADREIVAPAGFRPPNLIYITSIDGYLYCVDDMKRQVIWSVSLGTPMSQSPLAAGDVVYVVTDEAELMCLDALTGEPVWGPALDVKQLLTISKDRVYGLNPRGDLVLISTENGSRLRTIALNGTAIPFANTQTDRLFLTNPQGLVVCLHEVQNEFPRLHVDVGETTEETDAPTKTEDPPDKPTAKDDPFGGF